MKALLIFLLLASSLFPAAAQDDELAGRFLANCNWITAEGHERYSNDAAYKGKLMQFAVAVKVDASGKPEKAVIFDKDALLDSLLNGEAAIAQILAEREAFKNTSSTVVVCYVTVQNMSGETTNKLRNPDAAVRNTALKQLAPFKSVRIIDPFIIAVGMM
ncbi:hypothetical protein [Pedobacter sp. SYP-B3415]|uniref:hypothetical protein n=1 Tax=Pedobacter sp. SYP-B3415 TaxID=2496641 RepID=UPI00101C657F|nr:hypothetical protein [Pedobacter sp. SYP-B3415]